jgi:hypothetical protein
MEKPMTFYVSKIETETEEFFLLKVSGHSWELQLPAELTKTSFERIKTTLMSTLIAENEGMNKMPVKEIKFVFNNELFIQAEAVQILNNTWFDGLKNVKLTVPVSEEDIRFFFKILLDIKKE